jgi:hypothetical protein
MQPRERLYSVFRFSLLRERGCVGALPVEAARSICAQRLVSVLYERGAPFISSHLHPPRSKGSLESLLPNLTFL